MIGLFDSGVGGISVLNLFHEKLSKYSYIYFADTLHSPYGSKSSEEIYFYSKQIIEFLFLNGAKIVIVACNTISATVLRDLQDNYFNLNFPKNKVLGIIIPNVENILSLNIKKGLGIIGTELTIGSNKYKNELLKKGWTIDIYSKSCPFFAKKIEENKFKTLEFLANIKKEISYFKNKSISHLLLACTHYSFIKKEIKKELSNNIIIIDSSEIVLSKTLYYLSKHKEIKLKKDSFSTLYTSGEIKAFKKALKPLLKNKLKRKIKILKSPVFSNY